MRGAAAIGGDKKGGKMKRCFFFHRFVNSITFAVLFASKKEGLKTTFSSFIEFDSYFSTEIITLL